jgi:DNA gyrase inhibitor GyrI
VELHNPPSLVQVFLDEQELELVVNMLETAIRGASEEGGQWCARQLRIVVERLREARERFHAQWLKVMKEQYLDKPCYRR